MVSRRRVIVGALATPLALVIGGRGGQAQAQARRAALVAGRVHAGTQVKAAGRGTRPLLVRGGHVRVGGELAMSGGRVFSSNNQNDAYLGVVMLAKKPDDMPYLVVRRGVVRAESWGTGYGAGGGDRGGASFQLDRALADEVAALWKTTRRDRVPLGAGLVGRWKPAGPFVVGKPMEIVLTLENGGSAPVYFNVGGRQRGPRDNRFSFEASRDGAALPVIQAYDFGGIGAVQPLAPGATQERRANLAQWATLDRPGAYRVRCRYELELNVSERGVSWPDHGHEQWDWATDDVIDITVG